MLRLPLFIVYAMIAFNITAFTVFLQVAPLVKSELMDMLIFNSIIIKMICWMLTIGAWLVTYIYRNKFVTLF